VDENEVQLLRLVGKQPEATRNALQSPAKEPKLHLSQNLGTRWGILQEAPESEIHSIIEVSSCGVHPVVR
jgi:hypothetical protein